MILVGRPPGVMEAVAYGRKKVRVAVKWDSFCRDGILEHDSTHVEYTAAGGYRAHSPHLKC
jgi:hypothetical protein